MLVPIIYYLLIPVWLCKRWTERCQFWAGCAVYVFLGPFLNISVLIYAVWNMDSFGWGKTRKVLSESESGSKGTDQEKSDQISGEQDTTVQAALAANVIATTQKIEISSQRRPVDDEEKTIGL